MRANTGSSASGGMDVNIAATQPGLDMRHRFDQFAGARGLRIVEHRPALSFFDNAATSQVAIKTVHDVGAFGGGPGNFNKFLGIKGLRTNDRHGDAGGAKLCDQGTGGKEIAAGIPPYYLVD